MNKKVYQFKNRICPACNGVVGAYSYVINPIDGLKYHTGCMVLDVINK